MIKIVGIYYTICSFKDYFIAGRTESQIQVHQKKLVRKQTTSKINAERGASRKMLHILGTRETMAESVVSFTESMVPSDLPKCGA